MEKDLHLNPDKIRINTPNIPFFGQVLTKEGLKPDPHKVEVIQQWPTPTCVTELQFPLRKTRKFSGYNNLYFLIWCAERNRQAFGFIHHDRSQYIK